ncbi:hypothetical protein AB833_14295 [Chromatiales bacterium (ex Bugula neritina AB1)]|nr:hypothetical protein AB833_14295 [Chromatiales bacterium (ex Bugula neritina AB1)]
MDFSCNSATFRRGPLWWNDSTPPDNGTQTEVDDQRFVYYDGYWIRYYQPPAESLLARKNLIESLTRRTFHHTEHGINTPGHALEEARAAFENETDDRKKRVNAAMLAGALFNRATDIFRTVVELGANGVKISRNNELMQECGQCFKEALDLGKQVKHYSGQEGIDELWGEPFRAFTVPIEQFYESRFIKIAQAMCNIDCVADRMKQVLQPLPSFEDADRLIDYFATAAKYECETMRSDSVNNFLIWPEFVSASERLAEFPGHPYRDPQLPVWLHSNGTKLIYDGKSLIQWIALARVPMPVSTEMFIDECNEFKSATLRVKQPLKQQR